MGMNKILLSLSLLACVSLSSSPSWAWPQKNNEPIRIVVTFPTGGAPDILARLLAEQWQKELQNQVIVENKSGAGGNIGTDFVTKAAPDGHTLLIGTIGTLTINPYLYKNLSFDPQRDLEAITFLASTPNVLVVPKQLPVQDTKSLIQLARSKPYALSYSSSGIGTSIHLSGELFAQLTQSKIKHIPYKGRAQAMPDLLAGRVDMSFDNLASAIPLIRSGDLRAIGVTSAQRSSFAPEIPTLAETDPSLRIFNVTSWFSLMGPKGMSNQDVAKISADVKRFMQLPEVREKLAHYALEANPQGPQALQKQIQQDAKRWSKLIKDNGIQAE